MSGLPPINLQSDNMLPAVYRRTDITRQVVTTGKQSLSGSSGEHLIDARNNGYKRVQTNCAAQLEPDAVYRKGMIIDIWT
jgi:hypothetical protein